MKIKVLFICSFNSVRSQMAEGILRQKGGDYVEVHSAGLMQTGVNPMAVKVMQEVGIDISGQVSNSIAQFSGKEFDYVVTVCDVAQKMCPTFAGTKYRKIHWSIEDPATVQGTHEEKLKAFRQTRDLILKLVDDLLNKEILPKAKTQS